MSNSLIASGRPQRGVQAGDERLRARAEHGRAVQVRAAPRDGGGRGDAQAHPQAVRTVPLGRRQRGRLQGHRAVGGLQGEVMRRMV